jgi:hypothetical protein
MEHSDELLEPPRKALLRSKALISIDATASFVFGVTAIELIIRGVLLRPMIYGLTHETVANKLTQIFLSKSRNSDVYTILNIMLSAFAKFDLSKYTSPLTKQRLTSELKSIFSKRNDIVHKGTEVAESDSQSVITVADDLLYQVVPQVLKGIDLGVSAANGKIEYY